MEESIDVILYRSVIYSHNGSIIPADHSGKVLGWAISPLHRRKVHVQRQPVPERVRLLPLQPVPAVVGELHVKVEDQAGEDESHLGVGEAMIEKFQVSSHVMT